MPLLPPVIATLFADTKEFMAKMDEAELKMGKFGAAADASGGKFGKFTQHASTAILGLGAALVAGGVDSALKFNESLDAIRNQAGASAAEVDYLKGVILNISDQTAISSENISSAFLQVEKAGIRGKAAYNLVDAAAKAAAITGGDVTTMTQTLVGIQNLQIAKGMSVAQVTDLMVLANQRHVGSLDSLTSTLTGKTGGALAAAGLNLAEMASVADIAAKAGYNNARAYTQLATGLTKIESPTTASSKAMEKLGINADQLAAIARHPGTGLVDVLGYLEQRSKATGISMNTLIKDTFGPGAVGLVTTLSTHIKDLAKNVSTLNTASSKGLNTAFGITQTQVNFQLKQLKTQGKNALTGFGLLFLPTVSDIANFAENLVSYFKKHPLAQTIFTDASLTLVAASFAFKLTSAIGKIPFLGDALKAIPGLGKLFGATKGVITAEQGATQIGLLQEIATNTAAISGFSEKTVAEEAVADTELGVADIEGGAGVFAPLVGIALAAGGLTYLLAKEVLKTPTAPNTYGSIQGLESWNYAAAGMRIGPKGATPGYTGIGSPNYNAGFSEDWVHKIIDTKKDKYGSQMVENAVLSKQQWEAIRTYFEKNHLLEFSKGEATPAFLNAVNNFMAANAQGKKNYSVVVNIKA